METRRSRFPFPETFAVSPDSRQSSSIRINVRSFSPNSGRARSFKKKRCYSAARKKRKAKGDTGEKTDETIFTRAVKAFSVNAIRTKHSGLMCRLLSQAFLHPRTLGALKNSFHPEARSLARERDREGLNENPLLTCFPCAVH